MLNNGSVQEIYMKFHSLEMNSAWVSSQDFLIYFISKDTQRVSSWISSKTRINQICNGSFHDIAWKSYLLFMIDTHTRFIPFVARLTTNFLNCLRICSSLSIRLKHVIYTRNKVSATLLSYLRQFDFIQNIR